MLVRKATVFPVECVVRGYLVGSGWKDYQKDGAVCGVALPRGLVEGSQLLQPIFTPATKAPEGEHDENITFERAAELVGGELGAEALRELSIKIYTEGAAYARERGIIIADTKFEFGSGSHPLAGVFLVDEVLTPDSSRFWPADQYEPGRSQPSFDKQFVRDFVSSLGWNKEPPVPSFQRASSSRRAQSTSRPTNDLRSAHFRGSELCFDHGQLFTPQSETAGVFSLT